MTEKYSIDVKWGFRVYQIQDVNGTQTIGELIEEREVRTSQLDLYPDEPITLSLQINDVKDPSINTFSFTRSFQVPMTSANNIIFDRAWLGINKSPYQIGKPQVRGTEWWVPFRDAYIRIEEIAEYKGTLELQSTTPDGYEVLFVSQGVWALDTWNDITLPQLNWEDWNITFTGNPSEYFSAMANTDADVVFPFGGQPTYGFTLGYPDFGYTENLYLQGLTGDYPYLGYNTAEAQTAISPLAPATDPRTSPLRIGHNTLAYFYLKTLVDKAFEYVGLSYKSDFFQSQDFKSQVLLYNDLQRTYGNSFMRLADYAPGPFPQAQFYQDHRSPTGGAPTQYVERPINNLVDTLEDFAAGNTRQAPNDLFNKRSVSVGFGPTGGVCEDLFGLWQGNGSFVFASPGTYNIQVQIQSNIKYYWPVGSNYPHATYPLIGPSAGIAFENTSRGEREFVSTTGMVRWKPDLRGVTIPNQEKLIAFYANNVSGSPLTHTFTITTQEENEEWTLISAEDSTNYWAAPGGPALKAYAVNYSIIVEDITPQRLNVSKTLPPWTVKDFMTSLFKTFNLQVDFSPSKPYVEIEPVGQFYGEGTIQDWSTKVLPQALETSYIPPYKTIRVGGQTTDNWLDIAHQKTNIWNLNWGTRRHQNTWGEEDLDIFTQFSYPTPYWAKTTELTLVGGLTAGIPGSLIQTSEGVNVPVLALYPKDDNGERLESTTSSVFIGYNNGMVPDLITNLGGTAAPCLGTLSTLNDIAIMRTPSGATAGHVISPWSSLTGPTPKVLSNYPIDLTTYEGGLNPYTSQEDLYNLYWKSFIEETTGAITYSTEVYLTDKDWADFSFKPTIFIDTEENGQYYHIQTIDRDISGGDPISRITLKTFPPSLINKAALPYTPTKPKYK